MTLPNLSDHSRSIIFYFKPTYKKSFFNTNLIAIRSKIKLRYSLITIVNYNNRFLKKD